MFVLGSVLALIGLAGMGLGLILFVFFRGKRHRGLAVGFGGMLLVAFASGVIGRSEKPQITSTQSEVVATAGVDQVDDLPAPTQQDAVLTDPAALQAYCSSLPQFAALLTEADKKFGTEYSGERELWLNTRDEEVSARVTDAIGVPHAAWSSYANAHGWTHRCDATARNWAQVELTDLGLSTSDDGRRVSEAIEREYAARFLANSAEGPLFDLNRYSRATCTSDVVEGFRFVGCKMIGDRLTSGPLFYLVANQGGEPIIVPFDSATTAHMLKPRYPDKDSVALRVGKYVGPYPLPDANFANVEAFFK